MWFVLNLFSTVLQWLGPAALCVLLALLLLILSSDCDLTLRFYARWGRKPTVALRAKVVWLTGASSGIGEHLAYTLAANGAKLVLSSRREKELQRVLQNCKECSPEEFKDSHMVLQMDLLDSKEQHDELCLKVLEHYGRIDFLVNNAGRSQRAVAMDTEQAVDKALLELNVIGTISLTKSVLPHMVEQKEGALIFMSSVAGKMGAPGSASYCASKHALQGFLETLRMEIADTGVGVLSVCPGPVETPFRNSMFGNSLSKAPTVKNDKSEDTEARVPAARCAYYTVVAMANQLEEVWISNNPILMFTYLNQYAPTIARRLGKTVGNKRLKAVKSGRKVRARNTGML